MRGIARGLVSDNRPDTQLVEYIMGDWVATGKSKIFLGIWHTHCVFGSCESVLALYEGVIRAYCVN